MGKYTKNYRRITPFKYPHDIHERTETPPDFPDYKKYKPYLKTEFHNKCVYCRKSDAAQDKGSFHVEHYRPKSLFPELKTDYDNLLYSCASCNRFKSSYWSDEKSLQILNPCIHQMNQYIKFEGLKVVPKNKQGELFIEILRVNNPDSLKYREILEATIISFLKNLVGKDLKSNNAKLDKTLYFLSQLIGEDPQRIKKVLRLV